MFYSNLTHILVKFAGAYGPGRPAPGGAFAPAELLGPAPGGAFAPAVFSGPAPGGACPRRGLAPPGAGPCRGLPRAPTILDYNTIIIVNMYIYLDS